MTPKSGTDNCQGRRGARGEQDTTETMNSPDRKLYLRHATVVNELAQWRDGESQARNSSIFWSQSQQSGYIKYIRENGVFHS